MEIEAFKLISASPITLEAFEEEINKHIQEGWTLHGTIIFVPSVGKQPMQSPSKIVQPMVKLKK